jgi:hypothetical protein
VASSDIARLLGLVSFFIVAWSLLRSLVKYRDQWGARRAGTSSPSWLNLAYGVGIAVVLLASAVVAYINYLVTLIVIRFLPVL